jgi:hypothetical protein
MLNYSEIMKLLYIPVYRKGSDKKLYSYIFCLFICGLFNDADSNSDYRASNDRMNNELKIGKDMEGSLRGLV